MDSIRTLFTKQSSLIGFWFRPSQCLFIETPCSSYNALGLLSNCKKGIDPKKAAFTGGDPVKLQFCFLVLISRSRYDSKAHKPNETSCFWFSSILSQLSESINYRPQTKLRKGNVFSSLCQEFCPQVGSTLL